MVATVTTVAVGDLRPKTWVRLATGERAMVVSHGSDDQAAGGFTFTMLWVPGRRKRSPDDAKRYQYPRTLAVRVEIAS